MKRPSTSRGVVWLDGIIVCDHGKSFDAPRIQTSGITGQGRASICQRFEYLGRMDIASATGQGSRFTLTVPLQLPR